MSFPVKQPNNGHIRDKSDNRHDEHLFTFNRLRFDKPLGSFVKDPPRNRNQ